MTTTAKQSKHATKSTVTKSHVASAEVAVAASVAPEPVAVAPSTTAVTPTPAPSSTGLQGRVTGAIALVNQAMAMLAITARPLSPAQVKASTKFRKGGEAQIPALAELSGTYGVEVPSRPTAAMQSNLAEAQVLAPLVTLVVRFMTVLESASFQVRSEAWATASTLYQMLRKASVRQPSLKADLAPLEEFFSYRHPLVKETAPPTAAAAAKAAKREANAAKKLARLQKAVTAKGGTVISDAPPAGSAGTEAAPPVAPVTQTTAATPVHS